MLWTPIASMRLKKEHGRKPAASDLGDNEPVQAEGETAT
jgi:hypothetical protein